MNSFLVQYFANAKGWCCLYNILAKTTVYCETNIDLSTSIYIKKEFT